MWFFWLDEDAALRTARSDAVDDVSKAMADPSRPVPLVALRIIQDTDAQLAAKLPQPSVDNRVTSDPACACASCGLPTMALAEAP